jgi:hypothetical protein
MSTKNVIASRPSLKPTVHRPIAPAGTTLVTPTFRRRFLAWSVDPTFDRRLVSDSAHGLPADALSPPQLLPIFYSGPDFPREGNVASVRRYHCRHRPSGLSTARSSESDAFGVKLATFAL